MRLVELVVASHDVVLDFAFCSRRSRDAYRALLEPTGVVPETVYLATERNTVLERMRQRRDVHADDIELGEEVVMKYFDHLEPPTPGEGPLTVISP